MYEDKIASLVRRACRRRENDRQYNILYEELAHYFLYRRKGFLSQQVPGVELNDDIWNNYPEMARRRMSEGLVASMCPKDRIWPGLRPANFGLLQIPEVRAWCDYAARAMYVAIYDPRANFTEFMNELADDASTFGIGVPYVDHNKIAKHLIFQVFHPKNFAFEFDASSNVTRQYCFWSMTIDDIARMFGEQSLPPEMLDEYRKIDTQQETKFHEVLHCILPNDDFARFGLAPGRLPYSSLWILVKGHHLLDHGGYHEFPYPVVRWYRRSEEGRGRGVAENALADARLLQAVSAALLEITEKQGNPPMQGPVDILRGEIELFPGGFTPFDASGFQYQGDPLRPVQLGANPAMTAEYLRSIENKIADAFFADAFSMPQRDAKQPDDASTQMAIAAAKLGPVFSRVENEMLPPILDRVFGIMMRNNAFPPIPQQLVGQQLIYVFDNQIADMREINEAQRILQGIGATAQFAQLPQAAKALDNLDWDIAYRDLWMKMKVPQEYMRDPQEVAAERQQQDQMQQAQQMAEMLKSGGPGMKQAVEGAAQARDQGMLPPPQ